MAGLYIIITELEIFLVYVIPISESESHRNALEFIANGNIIKIIGNVIIESITLEMFFRGFILDGLKKIVQKEMQ
jgi:membrane protease YdiL (CAAX protease family)